MQTWLPFVPGPALAMESKPGLLCFSVKFSSCKQGWMTDQAVHAMNGVVAKQSDRGSQQSISSVVKHAPDLHRTLSPAGWKNKFVASQPP